SEHPHPLPHPPPLTLLIFFFHSSGPHPDLHSFPTRRSSDLEDAPGVAGRHAGPAVGHLHPDEAGVAVGGRRDAHLAALRGELQRSEEHTSELQSRFDLVCRLLLEKKKKREKNTTTSYKKCGE